MWLWYTGFAPYDSWVGPYSCFSYCRLEVFHAGADLGPGSNRYLKIVLFATCDDNVVDLTMENGTLALLENLKQWKTYLEHHPTQLGSEE